jgi:hypothetical protein
MGTKEKEKKVTNIDLLLYCKKYYDPQQFHERMGVGLPGSEWALSDINGGYTLVTQLFYFFSFPQFFHSSATRIRRCWRFPCGARRSRCEARRPFDREEDCPRCRKKPCF